MSVVGNSGSGKSRLADHIAQDLDVPYVELDAIHHLAGWTPNDPGVFVAQIEDTASTDALVTGTIEPSLSRAQYGSAQTLSYG